MFGSLALTDTLSHKHNCVFLSAFAICLAMEVMLEMNVQIIWLHVGLLDSRPTTTQSSVGRAHRETHRLLGNNIDFADIELHPRNERVVSARHFIMLVICVGLLVSTSLFWLLVSLVRPMFFINFFLSMMLDNCQISGAPLGTPCVSDKIPVCWEAETGPWSLSMVVVCMLWPMATSCGVGSL